MCTLTQQLSDFLSSQSTTMSMILKDGPATQALLRCQSCKGRSADDNGTMAKTTGSTSERQNKVIRTPYRQEEKCQRKEEVDAKLLFTMNDIFTNLPPNQKAQASAVDMFPSIEWTSDSEDEGSDIQKDDEEDDEEEAAAAATRKEPVVVAGMFHDMPRCRRRRCSSDNVVLLQQQQPANKRHCSGLVRSKSLKSNLSALADTTQAKHEFAFHDLPSPPLFSIIAAVDTTTTALPCPTRTTAKVGEDGKASARHCPVSAARLELLESVTFQGASVQRLLQREN